MAGKLDYQWRLRHVLAEKGMFATTDLIEPLAQRGIHLLACGDATLFKVASRAPNGPWPEGADGAAGHPRLHDG
jgi:hypothetical protein